MAKIYRRLSLRASSSISSASESKWLASVLSERNFCMKSISPASPSFRSAKFSNIVHCSGVLLPLQLYMARSKLWEWSGRWCNRSIRFVLATAPPALANSDQLIFRRSWLWHRVQRPPQTAQQYFLRGKCFLQLLFCLFFMCLRISE